MGAADWNLLSLCWAEVEFLPIYLRPEYQVSNGSLIAALIVALLFHLPVVMDPSQNAKFPLHEAAREGKSMLILSAGIT